MVALELAERMTITGQKVDDELFGRLKAQFSEKQIVELAATVAFENFRCKLNPAFGLAICYRRRGGTTSLKASKVFLPGSLSVSPSAGTYGDG